ncbi:MAG: Ig domain-containing protein, partial [Clostridia bacterium]|nr:Ig domain-containing protein [Clostridia bacterium]
VSVSSEEVSEVSKPETVSDISTENPLETTSEPSEFEIFHIEESKDISEIEIQSEIEEISFTESSAEISEVKIEVSEQSSKTESSKPKEVSVNAQIEISRIEESSVQSVAETSKIPVSAVSVSLNKNSLSMMVGDTEKLTATILPENVGDNTLEWYWSDAGVVNIDENGNVTALKAGTADITVKTINGKSAVCHVTVKEKEVSKMPEPQISKEPEQSKIEESSVINSEYAAYYAPYDWNKIISDLREVGEKEYGMIWEESLWVKNRGMDYGSKFDDEYGYDIIDGHHKGCASYGFPVANTDNYDGEDFRNACIHLFENLSRKKSANNRSTQNCMFKIVWEYIGNNINGDDEYWIYLLYT